MTLIGEDSGTMVDDKSGDIGRCGGGVGDNALGVACPDDVGDPIGDEFRGEYWPVY